MKDNLSRPILPRNCLNPPIYSRWRTLSWTSPTLVLSKKERTASKNRGSVSSSPMVVLPGLAIFGPPPESFPSRLVFGVRFCLTLGTPLPRQAFVNTLQRSTSEFPFPCRSRCSKAAFWDKCAGDGAFLGVKPKD